MNLLTSLLNPNFLNILFDKNGNFNKNLHHEPTYRNFKADSQTIKCKYFTELCEPNRKTVPKENMFDTPYIIGKNEKKIMFVSNDPGGYPSRIDNAPINGKKYIHPNYFILEHFTQLEIKNITDEKHMLRELFTKINQKPNNYGLFSYIYHMVNKSQKDFTSFIENTYFTDTCKCFAGGGIESPVMREKCIEYVLKKEIFTVYPKYLIIHGGATSKNLQLKHKNKIGEIRHVNGDSIKKINEIDISYFNNQLNLSLADLEYIIQIPHASKNSFRQFGNWDFTDLISILKKKVL